MRHTPLLLCLVALGAVCVTAKAESRGHEFAFGIGYAHLFWDGTHSDALEEQGGLRMDGWFSFPVARNERETGRPELRLGIGLALEFFVSERGGDVFEVGDVIIVEPNDWDQLSLIQPEVQFSIRAPVNDNWYVEPGLAAVGIVGNFIRGEEFFGFVDEDIDRWRVGGAGRAYVRLAYRKGRSAWGVEGSYSYGWLDFGDDIGGDIQRGHLTFFYARSF